MYEEDLKELRNQAARGRKEEEAAAAAVSCALICLLRNKLLYNKRIRKKKLVQSTYLL